MNHSDDRLLSNDWLPVDEPVLYLRVDLIIDHLVIQVSDK